MTLPLFESFRRFRRKDIVWRLHLASSQERVFDAWIDADAHKRFWCERSRPLPGGYDLEFIDGTHGRCIVIDVIRPSLIRFSYFGSAVEISLEAVSSGTDLTLIAKNVSRSDWADTHAGWLNVLLPLKAWLDFKVDLRNHDPLRTWQQRFVDQ